MESQQEVQKKCKRGGCQKKYLESENNDQACHFHPGKPIFHDLKKGWTCCNKVVYDWDEFKTIPTCAVGSHSDVDPNKAAQGQDAFYKSDTVSNAAKAQDKHEKKVEVKKISDFNKQEDIKKAEQAEQEAKVEKKIFEKDGKYKCTRKGCQKFYLPEENIENCCSFHPGQPVFHDIKKYYTCCKKETYDWDEFMKLPTCATGMHDPKMI